MFGFASSNIARIYWKTTHSLKEKSFTQKYFALKYMCFHQTEKKTVREPKIFYTKIPSNIALFLLQMGNAHTHGGGSSADGHASSGAGGAGGRRKSFGGEKAANYVEIGPPPSSKNGGGKSAAGCPTYDDAMIGPVDITMVHGDRSRRTSSPGVPYHSAVSGSNKQQLAAQQPQQGPNRVLPPHRPRATTEVNNRTSR